MRRLQGLGAFCNQLLLPGSELLVKRHQEVKESLRQIIVGIESRRRVIHSLRGGVSGMRYHKDQINSADVLKSVVDRALLGLALMLLEIGLQLGFRFIGVHNKFLPGSERQFANITIRSVRSAPDEADDSELAVGHADIMAARCCGVKSSVRELGRS